MIQEDSSRNEGLSALGCWTSIAALLLNIDLELIGGGWDGMWFTDSPSTIPH